MPPKVSPGEIGALVLHRAALGLPVSAEVDSGEVRAPEVGTRDVCAGHVLLVEVGATKVHWAHRGALIPVLSMAKDVV